MPNVISKTEKDIIFNLINEEFLVYKNLEPYEYLFITESWMLYNGLFLKGDFLHLTGITIRDGNDEEFYNKLSNNTATKEMISDIQIHDMKTINRKARIMKNLEMFVENKCNSFNLLIENFGTLTTDHLIYAIRNDELKYTLAFTNSNNARSSRYELASVGTKREKIICIFKKGRNTSIYDSLVYKDKDLEIETIVINLPKEYSLTNDGCIKYTN